MLITSSELQILRVLRRRGPLSRRQLHEVTKLRPNTVGELAAALVERGLLTEGPALSDGPGRPRVPLELDSSRRWVVGLALRPGHLEVARMNLRGQVRGQVETVRVSRQQSLPQVAADVLTRTLSPEVLAVGITTTGLLDTDTRQILLSSALPDQRPASAEPIYEAVGDLPLRFDNDMRALATRWQLAHSSEPREDLLLVMVRDGAVGASLMIDGQPNRGCVVGGNELGWMHLPVGVSTMKIEDIFSTTHLHRLDPARSGDLAQRVTRYAPGAGDRALEQVAEALALVLANAASFIRPDRMVLAGELMQQPVFFHLLTDGMRRTMLRPVAERMRIEPWRGASGEGTAGEDAAWLGLDLVFGEGA